MGATNARFADAELHLAVPRHISMMNRRVLDISARRCAVCRRLFTFGRNKHYCRRCGRICCLACTTFRRYCPGRGADSYFRVCRDCNTRVSLLSLPARVWHGVLSFCDPRTAGRALILCRATLTGVPLPFPSAEWETHFASAAPLSSGAHGLVYRATWRQTNAPVAVKVIAKRRVYSLRAWEAVRREAETLRRCAHPHIIPLAALLQSSGEVYIVMPLATGGDLFDWLAAKQTLPRESEVRCIARQLLQVLCHMHDTCGVVHRDIKPENILVREPTRGGEVPHILLADFGFARCVTPQATTHTPNKGTPFPPNASLPLGDAEKEAAALLEGSTTSEQSLSRSDETPDADEPKHAEGEETVAGHTNTTRTGNASQPLPINGTIALQEAPIEATPCGTLGFAAPEVLALCGTRRPITSAETMKRMDIFAAGVTLCVLCTGREPFPSGSATVNMAAMRNGARLVGPTWAHVSPAAKMLLRRMLAPNPADRPTARECLNSSFLGKYEGTLCVK